MLAAALDRLWACGTSPLEDWEAVFSGLLAAQRAWIDERTRAAADERLEHGEAARAEAEAQSASLRREVASLRAKLAEKDVKAKAERAAASFRSGAQSVMLESAKQRSTFDGFVRDFGGRPLGDQTTTLSVLLETIDGDDERLHALRELFGLSSDSARAALVNELIGALPSATWPELLAEHASELGTESSRVAA